MRKRYFIVSLAVIMLLCACNGKTNQKNVISEIVGPQGVKRLAKAIKEYK